MNNFIQALHSRDMIHDLVPGTEKLLQDTPTAAYIGIDPTAPSLHIGNLATLMLLKHLQRAGHQPIVLLGGATAMIGDPSFKSEERKLLDRPTIERHQNAIQKQILHLFQDDPGKHTIKVLNNYDWLHKTNFISFLRDVGKHITLNYLLAKEAVKSRLQTGISYTEFAYPLLQAYDFYYLYHHHGVKLQMGGSDQWGNITTGTEFIRKKSGKIAFGLTTPLITKADGTKFGKTEQGNVWLDPKRTSPYEFYQFWINTSDEEASLLMKKLTLVDVKKIEELIKNHELSPHKRLLQKELAKNMTIMVHSHQAYLQAKQASEILFSSSNLGLENLEESFFLEALKDVSTIKVNSEIITDSTMPLDLLCNLTQNKIFTSKRAAREMIQAGGVRINKVKVTYAEEKSNFNWLWGKYLVIQKGKKNYYLIQRAL